MADLLTSRQGNPVRCACGAPATVALDTRDLFVIPALDCLHRGDAGVCADVDHLQLAINGVHAASRYVVASRVVGA